MSRYSPMNPEYKTRWLKALRSGKYGQARGALRILTGDKRKHMCCLGVLCDLTNPKDWELLERYGEPIRYVFRGERGLPDKITMKETGFTMPKAEKLAWLNDQAKYTFKQIADFIEKNF